VPSVCVWNVSELGDSAAAGAPPAVPLPDSVTVWLDPVLELSTMYRVAVLDPAAVGVNVTETEQLLPAASVPPQLLLSPKSPELLPAIKIFEIVSGPAPVLETVTPSGLLDEPGNVLGKLSDEGDTAAVGVDSPVPDKGTDCVDPAALFALSVTLTYAICVPPAAGLKLTLITQEAKGAREAGQLLLCANSAAFAPVTEMLPSNSASVPGMLTVTVCAALVVFTFWLANVNDAGAKEIVGIP